MHRAILLVAAATLVGCDGGLVIPGTTEMLITTDRSEYLAEHVQGEGNQRRFEFTAIVRFENTGTGTTFLELCDPHDATPMYSVELLDGDDVTLGSGYSRVWACTGHDEAIRLDPGEDRSFSLLITGPNIWDGHTGEVRGALEGKMRLRFPLRCSRSPGCDVSASSNGFTVALDE